MGLFLGFIFKRGCREPHVVHGMGNPNLGIYPALQERLKYTLTLYMINVLVSADFF